MSDVMTYSEIEMHIIAAAAAAITCLLGIHPWPKIDVQLSKLFWKKKQHRVYKPLWDIIQQQCMAAISA